MKILSDFDGVLTDLTEESLRMLDIFRNKLVELTGATRHQWVSLLAQASDEIKSSPHENGWVNQNRLTAFANEDGFIWNNALAALLDRWAHAEYSPCPTLLQRLVDRGTPSFTELAIQSYYEMTEETSQGSRMPLDPMVPSLFDHLTKRGVEIVIVSNSDTDRIRQILTRAGLSLNERIRLRGNAKKFILGEERHGFGIDKYFVETNRPLFRSIIEDEKPDVFIGDVFSLDLSVPLEMAREGVIRPQQIWLRKQNYTPSWSLDFMRSAFSKEVNGAILENLDELSSLV